jgi:hypothetical protein
MGRIARLTAALTVSVSAYGNGGFQASPASMQGVCRSAMAWGDYDNDERLDLVVAGTTLTGAVCVLYRNEGAGVLQEVSTVFPGVENGAVAWGDYDNDGDLDLALAGLGSNGLLCLLFRNDGGAWSLAPAGFEGFDAGALAWGDYDNDGDLDLAASGVSANGPLTLIYVNEGEDKFRPLEAALPGLRWCDLEWGDYDRDGFLDLALAGNSGDQSLCHVFHNDGGVAFTDCGSSFHGVERCALAWGDYDNDADLDLVVSGYTVCPVASTTLYRNDSGVFHEAAAHLTGTLMSSLAWGDYDNDGDMDLAMSGLTGGTGYPVLRVYRNSGAALASVGPLFDGVYAGALRWGDCDGDGQLDLAVSGMSTGGVVARVLQNLSAQSNAPPSAPTGLAMQATADGMIFRWNASSDPDSSTNGLSYNIRVGRSPGSDDVVSPMSQPDGRRKLPQRGNAEQNEFRVLRNLLPGRTYFWSVQAIDGGFGGSAFSAEASVDMPDRVEFGAPVYWVRENAASATVHIIRYGTDHADLAVECGTQDGSAVAGQDYRTTNAVVSLPIGLLTNVLTVSVLDDGAIGDPIALTVALSNLTGNAVLGVRTTAVIVIQDEDVDSDGMADDWERFYFGGTNRNGSGDFDDDHFPDHSEFVAGTGPDDSGSSLEITLARLPGDAGVVIAWPSVSNRNFTIHASTNLLAAGGQVLDAVSATPPLNTYTDDLGGRFQLYWLDVQARTNWP